MLKINVYKKSTPRPPESCNLDGLNAPFHCFEQVIIDNKWKSWSLKWNRSLFLRRPRSEGIILYISDGFFINPTDCNEVLTLLSSFDASKAPGPKWYSNTDT